MAHVPASIRTKNPGAQWPSKTSRKYGSTRHENLRDGNKIAIFPSSVQGAAALFDLLDRVYAGMTLGGALSKWSGGNHVKSYIAHMEKHTGMDADDMLDDAFFADEKLMIKWGKAMARHEAGRAYPMTYEEWGDAYDLYLRKGYDDLIKEPDYDVTKALAWAKQHVGEREIPGKAANDFILECFSEVGRPEVESDETPWCAAFAGAGLKASGYHHIDKNLLARAFMDYGEVIHEPEVGALAIFWRDNPRSYKGHVGFVESWDDRTVTIIGGNQSDEVSRQTRSRTGSKSQLLGYRRPIPALAPVKEVIVSDSVGYKVSGMFASIGVALGSVWDSFLGGLTSAGSVIGEFLGMIPESASHVNTYVSSASTLSTHSGLPWPAYASLAVVVSILGYNLYDTWNRKRNRKEIG